MKGKGKAKEQQECPLQCPDITVVDHMTNCAKYTSILQRTEDDCISIDELDSLQFELEYLLVAVTKRTQELEREMQLLSSWQDRKDKKAISGGKLESKSGGKRSRVSEGKPTKKCKGNSGKGHTPRRPKAKAAQPTRVQDYEYLDSPSEPPKPKNDPPNLFWASIEPYCAELNQGHIKFLEDWLEPQEDEASYYEVPPVGKHYAYKWGSKDIQEEQKEGVKACEKQKGYANNSSFNSSDAEKVLKKFEKESESEDGSAYGPLTECLVNCLIEENIMSSLEDNIDCGSELEDNERRSKMCLVKSMNLVNHMELEKRIHKALEDIGVLTFKEPEQEPAEDENLIELKKLQQTLKSVVEHNRAQKEWLLKLAQEEIEKQNLRKNLQAADAEVKQLYKSVVQTKKRNKPIPNNERNLIIAALKKRDDAIKLLESKGVSVL